MSRKNLLAAIGSVIGLIQPNRAKKAGPADLDLPWMESLLQADRPLRVPARRGGQPYLHHKAGHMARTRNRIARNSRVAQLKKGVYRR